MRLSLETARARILAAIPATSGHVIPLAQAQGRVLCRTIRTPCDLPRFDNSAMDGYALRACDVAKARSSKPIRLRLIGEAPAGKVFSGMLVPGACVRLFTGSPLPRGADAVVRQEATHLDPAQSEWVRVSAAVKTGDHVRRRGEDVRRGATLVARGVRLSAGQVSLLAAAGVSTVLVGRQPVVGLLATGNELCEPGQSLAPGQVYECNRLGLAAMIAECGGVPKTYPLVPDTEAATRAALQRAFAACDLVLTSGGVSVGKHDWVKPAFERLGGRLDFWQVAVKPGQPFVFGRWRGRLLLGLPGNPVSALVTFLLLARPALLRWQGAGETGLPEQPGWLAQAVANEGSRRHFLRVRVDGAGWIRLAGLQASHVLSGLGRANGLLAVPPHTRWPRGRRVRVLRWHG